MQLNPVPLETVTDGEVFLLNYIVAAASTRASSIVEEEDVDDIAETASQDDILQQLVINPEPSQALSVSSPEKPLGDVPDTPDAIRAEPVYTNTQQPLTLEPTPNVVALPPVEESKPALCPDGGDFGGTPESGRPRTYFIDGTGFHARNSYVVAN